MERVKINYGETDRVFETAMPKIPNKGDMIGFWDGPTWTIAEVNYLVYEFDELGNYLLVEINC